MKKLTPLFLLIFAAVNAQVYEKDPTFNTYQIPAGQYYADGSEITQSAIQPDGKIILAITNYSSFPASRLVRLDNNMLDTSFAIGAFNGVIKDFLLQPDGKVVAVGSFTTYDGIAAKYMVRLNTDGTRDTSFEMGPGFTTVTNSSYVWLEKVALQANGKILVGGDVTSYNGLSRSKMIRINIDGSPDPSFTVSPTISGRATYIKIQPDGKILACHLGRVLRLLDDGSMDPDFTYYTTSDGAPAFSGDTGDRVIKSMCILSDGKIVVGGRFETAFNMDRRDLVRLNADGTFDYTFESNGFYSFYNNIRRGVEAIVALPGDKVIVSGDFPYYLSNNAQKIVRLNYDGSYDGGFTGFASFAQDYNEQNTISGMQWTPDGKLIATGRINSYNGVAVNNIVKIDTDGNRDGTFHNICKGFNKPAKHIIKQPDGKLLVAGDFSMYDGQTRDRIVRINSDGSLDETFTVNAFKFLSPNTGLLDFTLQADGKILVASTGRYFGTDLGYGGSLVRLNANGSLDETFVSLTPGDYGLTGRRSSVAVQPDGKILVAGDGPDQESIRRLNPDGSPDATFTFTGATTGGGIVALQPDGRILASTGSAPYNLKLMRLLADGQIDPSFNVPATVAKVTAVTVQPDGKILYFADLLASHHVYRLNSDGSLDPSFLYSAASPFNPTASGHELLPDGKILIAVGAVAGSKFLKRINPDGSLDTTFDLGTGFGYGYGYGSSSIDPVSEMASDNYGRIVVVGTFRAFNGLAEDAIVRLRPEGLLGIASVAAPEKMILYPNPVGDVLHISTQDIGPVEKVEIYSSEGVRVRSYFTDVIDVSQLATGIYLLKATSGARSSTMRFVKK